MINTRGDLFPIQYTVLQTDHFVYTHSPHKTYPVWCSIKYRSEGLISVVMKANDEIVGYATLLIDQPHGDYGYYGEFEHLPYLASFETKYKRQGYGRNFLDHILGAYGPFIFRAVGNSPLWYHKRGANIIWGDLYECECTMVYGMGNSEYSRTLCEACGMFHYIEEPDECIC